MKQVVITACDGVGKQDKRMVVHTRFFNCMERIIAFMFNKEIIRERIR